MSTQPLAAEEVAAAGTVPPALPLRQVRIDGRDVYWLENRPDGRGVIMCWTGVEVTDATPDSVSVGSRVNEYGGGDFAVNDHVIWYVDAHDQQIYRQEAGRITLHSLGSSNARFGALGVSNTRQLLVCVRELHNCDGEPLHSLVTFPTAEPSTPRVIADGRDFYADPAVSPDGRWIAWIEWSHPHMPWQESELWCAELTDDGALARARRVAGGGDESVFQPTWSPANELHAASDRNGWWNIYRREGHELVPVTQSEEDVGVPQWLLGSSTFAFLPDGRISFVAARDGTQRLHLLDPATGDIQEPLPELTAFVPATISAGEIVAFVAGSPTEALAVHALAPGTGRACVLRRTVPEPPKRISLPQTLSFTSTYGETYAFFYAALETEERPPLVVMVHGGPTNAAAAKLDLGTQFWTSRGFAYLDVNYGGSSGYGRAYRDRLHRNWGVVDVVDTVAAAQAVIDLGLADPRRLVVRGASAGGFTVCHALAGESIFAAGTSYFGVLDLERLAASMHKFEAHYLEWLLGPYPEERTTYLERSPLRFADRIARPLLFLQGLQDRVVPPSQVEAMVEQLRARRLPFAYLVFEGEQHGFRRANTIARCLEAEYAFYCRVLAIEPRTPLLPLEIENL